ncbi:helix-turn-helix transcriptional regulator [Mesorhizobium sp. B2-2-4]|nr:helix-turn-helix transcriptional regulator [Mesorhizobium sp. B2-2-4]TPM62112.1 helix-turn-helix transcriptional regulator [Mesorhizobium sp. B2-2-1]TPN68483.1 helix-turn-helix transcriptional regulator [Mesorhizobium sp. B1-1-3]
MEQEIDVRSIRTKLRLTQAQLADAVGVDQSTVSNWENGMLPRGPARKLLHALEASAPAQEDAA